MIIIDWFTVIAQIVNFLILMLLLRRLLYRPILAAMQDREHKISARLDEATRKAEAADQAGAAYRQQAAALEAEQAAILSETRREAETLRAGLLERAKADADEARARWRQALEQERGAFLDAVSERMGAQVRAIVQRALSDLADSDLERQVAAVFARRLRGLGDAERAALGEAALRDAQALVVSAFPLPPEARQQIQDAVDIIVPGRRARFDTASDTLCGVELRVDGYKIAWSLASYLEALGEDMAAVFAAKAEDSL
jgi:F-type H+-transporting ATPase subunit b